jgi:1-acyl-sn-glycerol-3-phosphate acyltransferase
MSASGRRDIRLPDWLVQNRNFVLLWAAYGVAAVGDHLSEIALLKARGGLDPNRPDSTRVQALIGFGFFLPFVILGPFAGWWSDRFSRKITMVVADLLRAAIVFNLAWIVAYLGKWLDPDGTDPYGLGDFSIVLPLFLVGALAAFFSPARQAMLPTLIRDDQLVRANAMISALGTIGTIASAVLGGYLVKHLGAVWNFHINAMTFTLSAMFVGLIAMSRTRAVPHPPLVGVWTPVLDGFRYVRRHRRVFEMILLGTVFWAAAGVVISVVPTLVKGYFGEDYARAGEFRGLIGAGLAIGAAVMTLIGPTMPVQIAVLASLASAMFWMLLLATAALFHLGTILTGVCLFAIGGAGAALLVTIMATIQRFVPDSRRGRVFGVADMATMGAMVAASGALGLPHIPDLDRYIPLLLAAVAAALAAALVIAWREYWRGGVSDPLTCFILKLIEFYSHCWCRMKRIGPCTVPRTGPVIIVANHTSGVDPILILASCTHRTVAFLVAEEFYARPIPRWFMRRVHCIPINRANPGKSVFAACLRTLRSGGALGIFPQGGYVAPGETAPEAKAGVGFLAVRSGAVVVPCHISGTTYDDDPLRGYFRRHKVRIRYGAPIDLSPFADRDDKETPERVTTLIMQKIHELAPEATDHALTPVH